MTLGDCKVHELKMSSLVFLNVPKKLHMFWSFGSLSLSKNTQCGQITLRCISIPGVNSACDAVNASYVINSKHSALLLARI